jgi:hypothetical protein
MKRRTLLQSLAAAFTATRVWPSAALRAQSPPPLTDANIAALTGIAEVVLPSSLDAANRDAVVSRFVNWVRNYREGADRGHGYGASRLSAPTGPSPAAMYPPQFATLDRYATEAGAPDFARAPRDVRRAVVLRALNEPQPTQRMPASPTGANLVADFMGLYFNGADAWDLCYQAEIGSDRCRTLEGSEKPPAPIGGR